MNVRVALICGVVAGLLQFGVRKTLDTFVLVGSGDANAGYAAIAVLVAGLLLATIVAGIVQFAVLSGAPGRAAPTGVALSVLGACAALLGPVTFFVSVAIFAGACVYALLAAADGRSLSGAIAESCRVAIAAPGPTASACAVLAAGTVAGGLLGGLVASVVPLAGDLLAGIVGQVGVGYVAPRVAATYLKLQARPEGS